MLVDRDRGESRPAARAYWLSLQRGYDEITGQNTVTVYIPEKIHLMLRPYES